MPSKWADQHSVYFEMVMQLMELERDRANATDETERRALEQAIAELQQRIRPGKA